MKINEVETGHEGVIANTIVSARALKNFVGLHEDYNGNILKKKKKKQTELNNFEHLTHSTIIPTKGAALRYGWKSRRGVKD